MSLSVREVIELKKYIRDKCNIEIHLHDTCGGQYFTIDKKHSRVKKYIDSYLNTINKTAVFNEDFSFFVK